MKQLGFLLALVNLRTKPRAFSSRKFIKIGKICFEDIYFSIMASERDVGVMGKHRIELIPVEKEREQRGWLGLVRRYEQSITIVGLVTLTYLKENDDEADSFRFKIEDLNGEHEQKLQVGQTYRLGDLPVKVECQRERPRKNGWANFYLHGPASIKFLRTELLDR